MIAPFQERLLSRLIIMPSGCVEWTGAKNSKGYGSIKRDGRVVSVHRVMWELFEGPITAELQLDHLCRNRACANVAHLEIVTPQINQQRGLRGELLTMCSRGHPLDGRQKARGGRLHRYCLTCKRNRQRKRRA